MFSRRREYCGDSHIARNYALSDAYNGFRLIDIQPGQTLRNEGAPEFEVYLMLKGLAYSTFHDYRRKESGIGVYLPSSLLGSGLTPNIGVALDKLTILEPSEVVAINRNIVPLLYNDSAAMAEISAASENDFYNNKRLSIAKNQQTNLDSVGHLMFLLTKGGQVESPRLKQDVYANMLNMGRSRFSVAIGELIELEYLEMQKKNPNTYSFTVRGINQYSSEIAH